MHFPVLCGTIERRILVNYRVDPEILARTLPAPFRPQVIGGYGIAGICLIRLRRIRPRGWRAQVGFSSENAAHRIAVEWGEHGKLCRGVYVPRRESSSWFNMLVGGRLFPGEHHLSRFDVRESGGRYHVSVNHRDGTRISLDGHVTDQLPVDSVFGSLAEASEFFAAGALGYSATSQLGIYDGLELRTLDWNIEPLAVGNVVSSLFEDPQSYPVGSATFDSAFLMRNIEHEWHGRKPLCSTPFDPGTADVCYGPVGSPCSDRRMPTGDV
jgi:Uncharacterized conserved protein (COG2071)